MNATTNNPSKPEDVSSTVPMFKHCHVHDQVPPDTLLAMCGRVPELPVVAWPEKSDAQFPTETLRRIPSSLFKGCRTVDAHDRASMFKHCNTPVPMAAAPGTAYALEPMIKPPED